MFRIRKSDKTTDYWLWISVFVLLASAAGQPKSIPEITEGQAPKWSPDSVHIAFSGPQFRGIYVYSLENHQVDTLSTEQAAGFGMAWSPSGDRIAARVGMRIDGKQLFALVLYSLSDSVPYFLTNYESGMSGVPQWDGEGTRIWLNGSARIRQWDIPTKQPSTDPVWMVIKDQIVRIHSNGSRDVITLPEEGPVIETDIARDGMYLAFKVLGGHLWLLSADGSTQINLGLGNSPRFSPDGQRLCYTVIKDDGHRLTEADIYIMDLEDQTVINVTQSPDLVELHPDWSPDGTRIVYDTNDGRIWTLEVSK